MKKIVPLSCLVLLSFLSSGSVFANDPPADPSGGGPTGVESAPSTPTETTVIVTEQIPGMKCEDYYSKNKKTPPAGIKPDSPEFKKYECTIKSGFGSVMAIFKGLIKYATFITALVGVLMLVVSGIQYSLSGADKGAADAAKKRIEKVLAGIVLLFLIGFILNSVAPWVYR